MTLTRKVTNISHPSAMLLFKFLFFKLRIALHAKVLVLGPNRFGFIAKQFDSERVTLQIKVKNIYDLAEVRLLRVTGVLANAWPRT